MFSLKQALINDHADKHPIFILNNVTFQELQYIVQYIYYGDVNIPAHQITSFLKTAENLKIQGIEHVSKLFSANRISNTNNIENIKRQEPNLNNKSIIADFKSFNTEPKNVSNSKVQENISNEFKEDESSIQQNIDLNTLNFPKPQDSKMIIEEKSTNKIHDSKINYKKHDNNSKIGTFKNIKKNKISKLSETNLQKHLKLECGKKPSFKCEKCFRNFSRKSNLTRHFTNIHSK